MSALRLVVNNLVRRMDPSLSNWLFGGAKHDHYADFGFPGEVSFEMAFGRYCRNGIARAGVDKSVFKVWQDAPFVLEAERDGSQRLISDAETPLEKEIRQRFGDLRVWQQLAEADRRALVGGYAGLILRFADGQRFDQPVERVGGGLDGLVEVIPAWRGQLEVASWDDDQGSDTYGHPKMFAFNEAAIGGKQGQARAFQVHPDRVIIWSRDGTVHGRSLLEPGYNDLLTLEKVVGAGGEGFWKNAKSAPVLQLDKEARIEAMAEAMGVKPEDVVDKISDQVEGWSRGFDKLLMLQGMEAKSLGVTLPSPEHFFAIALQCFAASVQMPLKILVGSQTGERASTEDADEWSRTCMSRRSNEAIPNIKALVNRLERVGILPERDWYIDWSDLTETSPEAKLQRADKMADVNVKMRDSGELVFTPEEIRAEVDREPLSETDRYRDDLDDEETSGAPTGPADEVEAA